MTCQRCQERVRWRGTKQVGKQRICLGCVRVQVLNDGLRAGCEVKTVWGRDEGEREDNAQGDGGRGRRGDE